jgi:hypothetical protein
MGRRTGGEDGPRFSQGQPGLESVLSECLDPVAGYGWWDWWEDCGQELGDLESKVLAEWMEVA